jgi:hypothetical protein
LPTRGALNAPELACRGSFASIRWNSPKFARFSCVELDPNWTLVRAKAGFQRGSRSEKIE